MILFLVIVYRIKGLGVRRSICLRLIINLTDLLFILRIYLDRLFRRMESIIRYCFRVIVIYYWVVIILVVIGVVFFGKVFYRFLRWL